jgi:hypothetical protein
VPYPLALRTHVPMPRPRIYLSQEEAKEAKLRSNRASHQRRNEQAINRNIEFIMYEPRLPDTPLPTSTAASLRTDLEITLDEDLEDKEDQDDEAQLQAIVISEKRGVQTVPLPQLLPPPMSQDHEDKDYLELEARLRNTAIADVINDEYEARILGQMNETEARENRGEGIRAFLFTFHRLSPF